MENKKRAYFIGGIAFCVVVAIILWFACAGRSTVHDLRNGSNDIRNELESAQDRQREEDKLLIQQQTQLTEAQKQLKIANEQLKKSKVLNEATENSLKIARESFNKYEKEAERKIRIKTRQRNMWIVISAVAVGAAISWR
ncbi:MAG: hypothetical protein ACLVHE_02000 [Dialister invisus]